MKSKRATLDYVNTHRDLIVQCQQGNRQAQFSLYKHYSRAMYNICLRMLNNEHDAEDVLQLAFVQVFRKIDTFRHESAIGAWIKRIVVNNCINFLKKKRIKTDEWDAKLDPVDESSEPPMPTGTTVAHIKSAMNNLPDGYRAVFSLYAMEGYDHQEIAGILGISEATSKSQYCRARKKLKEMLQNH